MKLTKKEFWNMIDSKQIFLKGNDTCLYNGVTYVIDCDDCSNSVELKEI